MTTANFQEFAMLVRALILSVAFGLNFVGLANAADKLDSILDPIRTKYDLPALAAGVARDGRIVARDAVGVRLYKSTIPVAVDDRFHLGSDTKAMTATLAAILVQDGKLSWTSTIGEVLGKQIPNLKPAFAAIKLEDLLSHQSGIPSDNDEIFALYFAAPDPDLSLTGTRLKLIETWGSQHEPTGNAPHPFQYSNLGYTIAGAMVEAVSGIAWEQMITERIFDPLNLQTAGLGPQASMGRIDAAIGHNIDDKGRITPRAWGPWADVPPVIGPAGNAHMSMSDFATWGSWNAGGGKRGPNIVKPDFVKQLHAERLTMTISNPKPGTPKSGGYAMGWGVIKFDWSKAPLLTHNGSNSMNLATILVDVGHDVAIAVATNIAGERADHALLAVTEALYRKYVPEGASTPR